MKKRSGLPDIRQPASAETGGTAGRSQGDVRHGAPDCKLPAPAAEDCVAHPGGEGGRRDSPSAKWRCLISDRWVALAISVAVPASAPDRRPNVPSSRWLPPARPVRL